VASYCCLIVSGLVGRFGQLDSGVRQITAFHIPGDMADLHSAVRPIGVGGLHTLTETVIIKVPHEAVRRLAARYPGIAEALWRDCMLDAAVLMQWVVNVGRRAARTRLAHIFCEMAIRYGNDRAALLRYRFPVTQEQLGEACAMTGVHINRSLRSLRGEKMVTMDRGMVTIHDWAELVRTGEFNAAYLVGDTGPERQQRLLAN
jgi:CRP-like cAMP-binding protein